MLHNNLYHSSSDNAFENFFYRKYKERKYSLVDQVFSVETAMFSPAVFQPTPMQDTQNPPKGPPKQQFLYISILVGYFYKKTRV